ncbi:3-deoxy-D-manno-octulosonic acid transferase [Neogemmobacter tilapiae]|uniref:3-deoxy-D-manno-octulosonic acid transferase n=1 Tax=Neogemmobacter tilapiae TaxID=875041 RepID=A0A918TMZ8_9RHOB|nr:glycosyltransferase N-terminal domain-containing protein [Gemmobacter tilapiae]GHC55329.1 3-deoxy-D-manno-octulosonic acid transferase [Gemmobacter tilapiae]
MPRSLGLSLYNLFGARPAPMLPPGAEQPVRPPGRLIWLHSSDGETAGTLAELGRRLVRDDGHNVLMTGGEAGGLLHDVAPEDAPAPIKAFLDHWRPDTLILSGGEVRATLLAELGARGVPVAMVNGRVPQLARGGWWPGLLRQSLGHVSQAFALDETAARALRKAGLEGVQVAGRMEEASAAIPAVEADRQALAEAIGTRPMWFAAAVPEAEEGAVIEAHRAAQRLAHRLLLILAPADLERAGALKGRLAEAGLDVACRMSGEEPDSETEVYLVGDPGEYGLWYRLAPISWLGGSLSAQGCLRNPMEAAALGSAIIHGPRPGGYGAAFGRLGAALAARSVASGADLAEALGDLLSPDRTARLAQSAWAVASDGAETTERAVQMIRGMLGEDQ